jgi:hypothetical protein
VLRLAVALEKWRSGSWGATTVGNRRRKEGEVREGRGKVGNKGRR